MPGFQLGTTTGIGPERLGHGIERKSPRSPTVFRLLWIQTHRSEKRHPLSQSNKKQRRQIGLNSFNSCISRFTVVKPTIVWAVLPVRTRLQEQSETLWTFPVGLECSLASQRYVSGAQIKLKLIESVEYSSLAYGLQSDIAIKRIHAQIQTLFFKFYYHHFMIILRYFPKENQIFFTIIIKTIKLILILTMDFFLFLFW